MPTEAMPTMCCRREFDVPYGELPTVIERLVKLSEQARHPAAAQACDGMVLDYTAAIELFDVVETGRLLVIWTATFVVPEDPTEVGEFLRDAVFRDFVDDLRRQVRRDAGLERAS